MGAPLNIWHSYYKANIPNLFPNLGTLEGFISLNKQRYQNLGLDISYLTISYKCYNYYISSPPSKTSKEQLSYILGTFFLATLI